ncbi:kinesin-like protein KIF11 [Osmerus mordax]|uniref:kinesin-like protein KIF11 n=1 Tax=Osmerus mordax TaxID=8014 RepID=UPI00351072C8
MSSHNSFNQIKRDEKGRNIQVVVRCRPFNTAERKTAHGVIDCDPNRKEILVRTGGVNDKAARKTYTFDMVFGQAAKQIEVYRSVVFPILDEVIMGYNCTVFAYGQTGTGKTFTMEGERSPNEEFTWEEDPLAGIIPRTLHQIFEKLTSNGTEFSVKVSLLEIYNEELFDLLSPSTDVNERLQLFDDPRNKRGVIIKGLEEITVHNKNEVYQILERGSAKRKTASTLMNAYSSRSHSVFSVTIHMKEITLDGEELVKIGKLNLVDLAGSENIGRSGAVDKRAREAGNINQSLLTLGRVITALVEKRPHVPYRESKLTRILQDSLGGRTKTSIIATVSPASINMEETLSTLEYANRAKNIMNKPEVNQKLTKRTLIKEYTEEIERLKRDLAATRDKNGVYLSAENYENMSSQISGQEEQITEYNDRISSMEEELRRITELFVDNKSKLDQCSDELDEKNQRLEETHKNLQQTQAKLSQEEFISSNLASTQEQLYSTAGQLLSTVDVSTSDVSGLHAKLDRKKQVEQHNNDIQMSFSQRMELMFSQMQHSLQDQGSRHQGMLDHCTGSVESLLAVNDKTFKSAMATVASSLGGIRELVVEGVAKVQSKMAEQESVCLQSRDSLQLLLEEHKQEMEEVLVAQVLPGLSAIMAMNDSLKTSMESHRTLATQMEAMKKEMSVFFSGHAGELAVLRETTTQGLGSLQAEHNSLKERISQADHKHQTGMSQVIHCLQNQLNLLAMETTSDYAGLMTATDALQGPVQTLQNTLTSQCSAAESQVSAQRDQLASTTSSLVSQLQQTAQEVQQTLEESSGYCGHLHSSLGGLGERSLQWCSSTREQAQSQAQEQLTLLKDNTVSTHTLLESVETGCEAHLQEVQGQLQQQQAEMVQGLVAMKQRTSTDHSALEDHQRELQAHMDGALARVHTFLAEELRQDVPTGTTPQRKEYKYPRVLAKSRSRAELLESLRQEQDELQAALAQCDTVEEEEQQQDQDSLEDQLNGYSDSTIECTYVDENLMCDENHRGPFFKKTKAHKKEIKALSRLKSAENETQATPPRSMLPLRSQN